MHPRRAGDPAAIVADVQDIKRILSWRLALDDLETIVASTCAGAKADRADILTLTGAIVKVVILAGGMGTRIAEESAVRPKPMIEIGGRPILWHIMKIYAHHGLSDFVICLGYKGYMIKEFFMNFVLHHSDVTIDATNNTVTYHQSSAEPWTITLVDTGEKTLTGGRIKRVRSTSIPSEPFCFTYGDGLSDVDIAGSIAFHRKEGRLATVTAVRPPGGYGALDLERRRGQKLRRETARRQCLYQWWFLCPRPGGDRPDRGRRYLLGGASRWSSLRATRSCRPIAMSASGSRWTRCATSWF